MDYALNALKTSPSEQTKLEAAETIIQYFQREKHGDIQLALHLLRDILRSHPTDRRVLELSNAAQALQGA
jgi:hypothetical protein